MKKIGLIINPIAGIGGKVGLKGSDGLDIIEKAKALGAVAESGEKALVALKALALTENDVEIYTYPGEMGADVCAKAGFKTVVLGQIEKDKTTSVDTMTAAKEILKNDIALLLFAGGDGTARNILDAVDGDTLVLGIPTGCKIHSGVYALNPRSAGILAAEVLQGKITRSKEAEVMDIDEELFRKDIVQAKLYGYMKIPDDTSLMQCRKSGGIVSDEAALEEIAEYVADTMEKDTLYIVGTGSTTAAIMKKLNLPYTLLGVDLVHNGKVLANDCTEKTILDYLRQYEKVKIIATIIGGQGYLFGRGNQQISADVLRRVGKDNIIIVATKNKIASLPGKNLYVDTGNEEVNELISGWKRVIVGYKYEVVMKICS
ncbi:MAG: ATP-NAD kinase [Negativicutes bacterium]|nr:ATP-NAD kinase [Negativicutes bacterium]